MCHPRDDLCKGLGVAGYTKFVCGSIAADCGVSLDLFCIVPGISMLCVTGHVCHVCQLAAALVVVIVSPQLWFSFVTLRSSGLVIVVICYLSVMGTFILSIAK